MLLDPTARPDTANPVTTPVTDTTPDLATTASTGTRPIVPDTLAPLARRARTERSAGLALVAMLFDRKWDVDDIAAVTCLTRRQIASLADVRHPRTASSDVADRLVADRLVARRAELPEQRRG